MISRKLETDVLLSLEQFPAVGIIGSRQAGKATLAMMIARGRSDKTVYLDLERPSDLAKVGDAELYLRSVADSLVIIDEVQNRPDLFPVIRSLIDEQRRPGRFLILGSASPALLKQSSATTSSFWGIRRPDPLGKAGVWSKSSPLRRRMPLRISTGPRRERRSTWSCSRPAAHW